MNSSDGRARLGAARPGGSPGEAGANEHHRFHGEGAVAFELYLAAEEGLHGGDGLGAEALVGGAVDLDGGAGAAGADAFGAEGGVEGPAAAAAAGNLDEDAAGHLAGEGDVAGIEEQQVEGGPARGEELGEVGVGVEGGGEVGGGLAQPDLGELGASVGRGDRLHHQGFLARVDAPLAAAGAGEVHAHHRGVGSGRAAGGGEGVGQPGSEEVGRREARRRAEAHEGLTVTGAGACGRVCGGAWA